MIYFEIELNHVQILNVRFDGTCSLCPDIWESSYSRPEPKDIEVLQSLVVDDEIHFKDNLVPYGSAGINVRKAIFESEVDVLPAHFFRNCKRLESVVLPRSLRIISTMAFMGCESLEEIELPESIEVIEEGAFAYCKNLKRIVIPNKVTSIADYCFYECSKLKYVELPSNLESLCPGCFYGCCSIGNLELPATLKRIGKYALKDCKISELVVPESVLDAEFNAFSNSGLTSLTWLSPHVGKPNTFEYEETYRRHGDEESKTIYCDICSKISHLHLGPLVTKVPSYFPNAEIIADNISLSTELNSRNMWDYNYKNNPDNWENGALYYGDKLIDVKKNIKGRCVVSAKTKVITREAFRGCSELYEVILPESVEELGIGVFEGCENLKSVILPRKLKGIPENAFRNCSSLQEIDGACEVLESIGDYAFDGCIALRTLCNRDFVHFELPVSLKHIGYGVFSKSSIQSCIVQLDFDSVPDGLFAHCSNLTSVTLSGDIKHIGKKAFYDCEKLEDIHIPQGVLSIGEEAFAFQDYKDRFWISDEEKAKRDRLKGLKQIEIPSSVEIIESSAFARCNQLSECAFGGEGVEFGSGVFYECEHLSKVSLPRNVSRISNNLFCGCKSLSSICFDDSIVAIEDGAFDGCSLAEIHLPKNLRSIGAYTFRGNNMRSVAIPSSVEVLGEGSFSYNTQLEDMVLPSQISSIPKSLFSGDVNLKCIGIPSGVISIGESSFERCESISDIVIPSSVSRIGKAAFCNCKSLSSVIIPNNVKEIEDVTFEGCENLGSLTFPHGLERIGKDVIKGTRVKQLLLPESISYIQDNAFYSCLSLKYVILQCGVNEDWGIEVFPAKCAVICQGRDVSQLLKNIDKNKFARWAAEEADFEKYLRDSFYAAYEGEYDPNGDYL